MNLRDCSNGKGGKRGASRTRKREEWYTSLFALVSAHEPSVSSCTRLSQLEDRVGSNRTSRILDSTDALVSAAFLTPLCRLQLILLLADSASFPRLNLLPSGSQVRTLLPHSSTFQTFGSLVNTPLDNEAQSRSTLPSTYDSLWSKIIEWSVSEYESWLESPESANTAPPPPSSPLLSPSLANKPLRQDASLTPLFLFSTIFPLLTLVDALPSPAPHLSSSASSSLSHLSDIVLSRSDLLPKSERDHLEDSTRLKGTLYLVDAVSRFALQAYRSEQEKVIVEGRSRSRNKLSKAGKQGEEKDSWRTKIEERVSHLEERKEEDSKRDSNTGRSSVEETLRVELYQFRLRIEKLEGREGKERDDGRADPRSLQTLEGIRAIDERPAERWQRAGDIHWTVILALVVGLFAGFLSAKHLDS